VLAELQALYQHEVTEPTNNTKKLVTNFVTADYEKEITYRDANTLRKMGLSKSGSEGATVASPAGSAATGTTDYSKQL
jgi:hypothetical protein